MAAFILSPERWRELSATSSPVAADGQQTPQAGPGIRRRISRVFYEAHHTPGIIYLKKIVGVSLSLSRRRVKRKWRHGIHIHNHNSNT